MDKNKVVVGLSGGVDSAVTAYLLKQKGYEVIGVTMRHFADENFTDDAREIAGYLGIDYKIVDMTQTFKEEIMDYFVKSYKEGKTPNPCVMCNTLVKWKSLLMAADEAGAYYVATGHYAKIEEKNGRYSVKNSVTADKDQTYALCLLSQDQLERTMMPLGDFTKDEVREIASKAGLFVAGKKDSQDICFIPDKDYASFLQEYTKTKTVPGNFVDKSGNVLGVHEGIEHYTIGQRKGLNLAMGHPVFVTAIEPSKNEVVIGENEDLFTDTFYVENMNFMFGSEDKLPKRLLCKIRYAHKGTMCTLSKEGHLYKAVFEEKVRAITKGQTAVFYEDEFIFSGGEIQ